MEKGLHGVMGRRITGAITDDGGNPLLTTSLGADGSQGAGAGLRRFITAGVYDGDFTLTPPSPDSEISAANVLPNWTLTRVAGTSIGVYSVADALSASGRVIRFVATAGPLNDEVYLEQIIPTNGSRGQSYSYAAKFTFLAATISTAALSVRATGQFLRNDGITTTGAAHTVDTVFSSLGALTDIVIRPPSGGVPVPSDASLLRLRIGVFYSTGAAATGSIDLCEVRVISGTDEIIIPDGTTPANTYATLTKAFGATVLDNQSANTKLSLGPTGILSFVGGAQGSVAVSTTGVVISTSGAGGGRITLSGGSLIVTPGTQTISAATDTISGGIGSYIDITVSGGPFTMTSAPTVVDGVDGQELTIINVNGNAITLSDQGTLANSNLRLTAATIALSARDSLKLRYSSTVGDWVQVTPLVNVI